MNIAQWLESLKDSGVELSLHLNGQDLSFRATQAALTPQVRSEIIARKAELIDYFKKSLASQEIKRSEKTDTFCLSAAQQRLWFQEQFNGAPNNLAGAVRLQGPLSVDALEGSLQGIINRHAVFRTRFSTGADGQSCQDIDECSPFVLQQKDLRHDAEPLTLARHLIQEQASEGFDLQKPVLLRASLYQIGFNDHLLFINMPHIVADGVSLQIFDKELTAGYAGQRIPDTALRYVDFAEWEAQQPPQTKALNYWRDQLADSQIVTLPTDFQGNSHHLYHASDCSLSLLTAHESELLKQFGRKRGATPFMTLLAAFSLCMWRVSGEADLTVATAINNRPKSELQNLIGFFLNIVALRVRPDQVLRFGDLVDAVRQTCLEAYEHQALPFEQLVEELQPERVESRNPIARIAFAVGDTPWMPGHTIQLPGLDLTPFEIDRGMLDFDMHLWVSDTPSGLSGRLEFRTDLYARHTAVNFLERFKTILQQLLQGLDRPLHECDALSPTERDIILHDWSGQPNSLAAKNNVVDAWRHAASKFSQNVALCYDQMTLDYSTLDELSDNLAATLIARNVGPGSIVGLYMPTGMAMVVSMLAVLKAGAAYLPLDVKMPAQRLQFILDDSEAVLIICDQELSNDLNVGLPILKLPACGKLSEPVTLPVAWPRIQASDLAYVMYTSGSTGEPKGVLVPHRAICRLVLDTNYVQITASDRIAQLANSAFDAFTFEVWGALVNGACVLGIDRDSSLNPVLLGDSLVKGQASIMFVTTALFNLLASEAPSSLGGLRCLLFGGEQADVGVVRNFLQQHPVRQLLHVYGPTENTTFSTFYVVENIASNTALLPIGKPVLGTGAFVLAKDLALVPPGSAGQLFLCGDGLADGYLRRPELDASSFVPHPFVSGARLYRTGDKVRFNHNGDLEFIGRIDNQIKLRGFRIELGEIEFHLLSIAGVSAALVQLEKTQAGQKIVAYVATTVDESRIRRALEENLPHYMLPSTIVCMDSLPLNRNGKIDRNALAALEKSTQRTITGPRDEIEADLINIWTSVIGCSEISVDDNFFDIGGHSLLATRIAARVSEHFKFKAELRALFEYPSVARYAEWLRSNLGQSASSVIEKIPVISRELPVLLSSAQERLWFLDQMNPGSPAYNISYALGIKGRLVVDVLEQALAALLQRHESLRTRFINKNGKPFQEVVSDLPLKLSQIDLRHVSPVRIQEELEERRLAEALKPFDTDQAPLIRACLYQLSDSQWVLGISLHHIIADGWSLSVLRRDLGKIYDGLIQGLPAELPVLCAQYADYAAWDRSQNTDLSEHLAYWKNELYDLSPLRLPTDLPRPTTPSFKGAAQRFSIDTEVAQSLRKISRQFGATLYMTLLTAFAVLLQRFSRQDDFAVGSPIAHRNHLDTENLIGFFVNTLVMRCRMDGDDTFVSHLLRMRETTLANYAHQDLPFERLVEELDPERDPTVNPLIQVIFALQNAPTSHQQLSEMLIEPLEYLVATTRFDLEMHLWENEQDSSGQSGLHGILVYDTALFNERTMASLCRCFVTLLGSICEQPESQISKLNILSETDRIRALSHNVPSTEYPREQSIVDLFSQQALINPEKTALIMGMHSLSYAELDRRSDRLASQLLQRGVLPESPILLRLEPSFDSVISMLAILKAGACYAPVDLREPASRLTSITESLKPSMTIDQDSFNSMMEDPSVPLDFAPPARSNADSLAYVLFTSGSTGQPKGVRIPHRAVVRLVKNTNFHPFGPDEVWLQAAPLAFDASTLEIWGALLNGASLAILPSGKASFADIGAAIQRHQVTSAWLTAGLFNVLIDTEIEALRGLRYLIAGGDVLSVKHVQKALRNLPGLTIVNGYGPTENTTFTCCHVMQCEPAMGSAIPIGQPVSNTTIYIVDTSLQPVPDGMPGELLTGGDGLARDYLDSPELTQARFIPNHFTNSPGDRLYRTGDLVRRAPGGEVEFVGRLDGQLKIRGFRVETGEIEHVLRSHPEVQDAVVLVHGQAEYKQIAAYVVPCLPNENQTRSQLGEEQVEDWEKLFDESLYQSLEAGVDPTFNISGWKSSFTGEPIATQEMREWLDDFVQTVQRYQPKRILEIGCGTGMVLFRLASECESYVGTDFSAQALAHVRRYLDADAPVELLRREALDFSGFKPKQFDTIIINSVIQYFPDSQYLHDVIAGCLPLIADGGRLVMGDLRSLPLLRAFHTAVTFARSNPKMRLREWRTQVDRAMLEEDELVIAPGFFHALDLPRIAQVRFRLQRPSYDNELSKYRYTAVIEVGSRCSESEIHWIQTQSPLEVEQLLATESPKQIGLRAVSNSRVSFDLLLVDQLETAARQEGYLDGLKRQLDKQVLSGTDPKVWWELGEKLGYVVDVGWSDGNPSGAYDVVFTKLTAGARVPVGVPAQVSEGPSINHPLRGKLARALGPKLRGLCQDQLPEYMLPAHFIMLPGLPLTPNGKIDKRAMALPENLTAVQREKVMVPENELEKIIASVWSDILGIEQPGVTDNFFDLGWHSMLMVQVCNRLRDQLSRDVPVLMMFQYPTIRALADALNVTPTSNVSNLRSNDAAAERARRQRQNIQARAASNTSQRK